MVAQSSQDCSRSKDWSDQIYQIYFKDLDWRSKFFEGLDHLIASLLWPWSELISTLTFRKNWYNFLRLTTYLAFNCNWTERGININHASKKEIICSWLFHSFKNNSDVPGKIIHSSIIYTSICTIHYKMNIILSSQQ